MTENSKLVDMCDSDNQRPNYQGGHGTWVSDLVRGRTESDDGLVVDIAGLSQLIETDINANSRISRNLTRKGSVKGSDKKINCNKRDTSQISSSSRATPHGGSMPEKSVGVALGATDHAIVPQVHHQITITNGCVGSAAAESKYFGKRFGFRRSSQTWIIDSRMLLFFFATLSCVGTILLIYFTLSMGKLGDDDDILN